MTMNETILRFGYPGTLIAAYRHWLVLLRPDQPTLGSLVLAAIGEARALGELPAEAFLELRDVVADIETALTAAVAYEKINYLMLMMVDPHVHWHVLPRYKDKRFGPGLAVEDTGWPKLPQLADAVSLAPAEVAALGEWLRSKWPAAAG
jgi:diadenosine tetraphosphate (Ap4A) HIT family hydrolase